MEVDVVVFGLFWLWFVVIGLYFFNEVVCVWVVRII